MRQSTAHRGYLAGDDGDRRARVVDRDPGDRGGMRPCEPRRVGEKEPADVEVVDDLGDEIGRVLDEGVVPFGVRRETEAAQCVLAEAVGRRDRGRVEVGDRA